MYGSKILGRRKGAPAHAAQAEPPPVESAPPAASETPQGAAGGDFMARRNAKGPGTGASLMARRRAMG